jgi:hypothetical protein
MAVPVLVYATYAILQRRVSGEHLPQVVLDLPEKDM